MLISFSPPIPLQTVQRQGCPMASVPCEPYGIALPFAVVKNHVISKWQRGKAAVVPFFHTSPVVLGGTGLHSFERLLQVSSALHSGEFTALLDHELFWDSTVNLSGRCVIHCR